MKKIYTLLFAVVFSITQIQTLSAILDENSDVEMVDFVNVRDLSSEMLQKIMKGKLPTIAIEFPEGDMFPLDLFLDGDLVSLVKPENSGLGIQFTRTVLVRNKNGKLLYSTDYHCWRPFRSFVKGKIEAGLHVNDEILGPMISFGVELNEKEHPYAR